jgi:hypothetical protein
MLRHKKNRLKKNYFLKIILCGSIAVFLFFDRSCAEEIMPRSPNSFKLNGVKVIEAPGVSRLELNIDTAEKNYSLGIMPELKKATQESLEYFFLGLALSDDKFWVNLNPQSPEKIIDPVLGQTSAGRILLEADLRLKKDTCELTNPKKSEIGKKYWQALYQKAGELGLADGTPEVKRLWIVPDEISVYETSDQIYIIRNKLKVSFESEYFSETNNLAQDKKSREFRDYMLTLTQDSITPALNKRVNEGPEYADLRTVYRSFILATWYKDKFGRGNNSLLKSIDATILNDIKKESADRKNEIYKDYLKSLSGGEYSFSENSPGLGEFSPVITQKVYFSGGIDLRTRTIIRLPGLPQDLKKIIVGVDIPGNQKSPMRFVKNRLEFILNIILELQRKLEALALQLPSPASSNSGDSAANAIKKVTANQHLLKNL